jgi:UDP-galactopyranose mutase
MPANGYTSMFRNMLSHPNIRIELGTSFREISNHIKAGKIYFSGQIDEYYNARFGGLPYRSLRFEHEHLPDTERFQKVGTVNYPNDHDFTRITEFKHLTGQRHSGTSIVREYPANHGDPYYPIPTPKNQARYEQYKELAASDNEVCFIGRLAQYRYYNMDQVVAAALSITRELI